MDLEDESWLLFRWSVHRQIMVGKGWICWAQVCRLAVSVERGLGSRIQHGEDHCI